MVGDPPRLGDVGEVAVQVRLPVDESGLVLVAERECRAVAGRKPCDLVVEVRFGGVVEDRARQSEQLKGRGEAF